MSYPDLTPQEAEFLRHIVNDHTPTEIAHAHRISHGRVRKVLRNLRDKFDVDQISDLADAARAAQADLPVEDDDDGRVHVGGW